MSRNLSVLSGKPAFGTFSQQLVQSDYINRKKIRQTCNKLNPNDFCKNNCNNLIPINKSNLIMGQYSKLDLDGVCTIIYSPPCNTSGCNQLCPNIPIASDGFTPFYAVYTIDPNGSLFGKSQCGSLNYTHYMKFSP